MNTDTYTDIYSKEPSLHPFELLFDGKIVALRSWNCCWRLAWTPVKVRREVLMESPSSYKTGYVDSHFPKGYIPKPEDFEVIQS